MRLLRTLIPSMSEKENVWMYCNYARYHNTENPCKNCVNKDCQHVGKETSY